MYLINYHDIRVELAEEDEVDGAEDHPDDGQDDVEHPEEGPGHPAAGHHHAVAQDAVGSGLGKAPKNSSNLKRQRTPPKNRSSGRLHGCMAVSSLRYMKQELTNPDPCASPSAVELEIDPLHVRSPDEGALHVPARLPHQLILTRRSRTTLSHLLVLQGYPNVRRRPTGI